MPRLFTLKIIQCYLLQVQAEQLLQLVHRPLEQVQLCFLLTCVEAYTVAPASIIAANTPKTKFFIVLNFNGLIN